MLYISYFLIELFALFLLSKSLSNHLFNLFYRVTKSKRLSIYLISTLFLPGTVVHELSHVIMAVILRVEVGQIEFMPKLIGDNLKLGSVQVAKSDPVRRTLMGTAPFLFGISIIIGIFFYVSTNNLINNQLIVILLLYLVFEIGNTMFSSKKDMEGALELMLVVSILIAILYFAGLRLPALNPDIIFGNPLVEQTFQEASLYIAAPIGIDILIIASLKLLKH